MITKSEIISEAFYANFDEADIKQSYIDLALDNTLKPLLGDDLYALVTANSPDANHVTLRDSYCKPLVSYAVKSIVISNVSPRATNIGASYTVQPNATASEGARDNALEVNDQMVVQYRQRLVSYLRNNSSLYAWDRLEKGREFITNRIIIP